MGVYMLGDILAYTLTTQKHPARPSFIDQITPIPFSEAKFTKLKGATVFDNFNYIIFRSVTLSQAIKASFWSCDAKALGVYYR